MCRTFRNFMKSLHRSRQIVQLEVSDFHNNELNINTVQDYYVDSGQRSIFDMTFSSNINVTKIGLDSDGDNPPYVIRLRKLGLIGDYHDYLISDFVYSSPDMRIHNIRFKVAQLVRNQQMEVTLVSKSNPNEVYVLGKITTSNLAWAALDYNNWGVTTQFMNGQLVEFPIKIDVGYLIDPEHVESGLTDIFSNYDGSIIFTYNNPDPGIMVDRTKPLQYLPCGFSLSVINLQATPGIRYEIHPNPHSRLDNSWGDTLTVILNEGWVSQTSGGGGSTDYELKDADFVNGAPTESRFEFFQLDHEIQSYERRDLRNSGYGSDYDIPVYLFADGKNKWDSDHMLYDTIPNVVFRLGDDLPDWSIVPVDNWSGGDQPAVKQVDDRAVIWVINAPSQLVDDFGGIDLSQYELDRGELHRLDGIDSGFSCKVAFKLKKSDGTTTRVYKVNFEVRFQ